MARIFCIASLALAAVSVVSGHVIPHHKRAPPGWQTDILQNYGVYHDRYLQWDCENQHNTTFFETCCHPLLKKESISVLENLGCENHSGDDCDGDSPSSAPSSSLEPFCSTCRANFYTGPTPTLTPTTTPHEAPASSSSPAPAPAQSSDGLDNTIHTGGVATFFTQNGVAGACGQVHQDTDFICAMDQARYGSSGGVSTLCGKRVQITADNGKTVTVTVADDCPTCDNENSIDLSVAAFEVLAPQSVGEIKITWQLVK
ncbi:RlpA-like double-psi beta-barrel-protein domain-containing protein-containing protein [Russula vinacea]|nr:RlpA-like double-psi beta-barrel-protein domain-containing protein-containing protein [Russula vinacea]